jgi:hypothetical protein
MISTQRSLDFALESKIGTMGPFNPNEWLIVFLVPFVLTGLTMAALFPVIRWLSIVSIFFWLWYMQRLILGMKKNKSKSWLFDISHKMRLIPFDSSTHFARPKKKQVYDGARRLVRGSWTKASKAVMVPTLPQHLTLGLPPIQIYDPVKKVLKRSITPQFKMDGYSIMKRVYAPGKTRLPYHWRHCVFARDQHGKAAFQNYEKVIILWRPIKESTDEK